MVAFLYKINIFELSRTPGVRLKDFELLFW